MPDSRYERVDSTADEDAPSGRLTPDSDSEQDAYDLDDLEEQDGYELRDIGNKRHRRSTSAEASIVHDDDDDDAVEETDEALLEPGRKRRRSSTHSFELYTPDEDRRVRRKLDTRLVLFVALLYMMSFLDRSNIGNAKVAGMSKDLELSDDQFEWLLTAFYIAYIAFEWMTMCYTIFPPHIYISCCVAAWGAVASLQALTTNLAFLLFLRVLLGIAEAAFVGMPIYLSFFFKREELAFRTGIFIAAAPLATSFASSLAYAIVRFGDFTGIASWRLLFLLEGFPACLVAVWTWIWLPDGPSTAKWLTVRERRIASLRVRKESNMNVKGSTIANTHANLHAPHHKQHFRWSEVMKTMLDPKTYVTAGMFLCCNVAFSSMPVFLPTIVSQMGYSDLSSQGLSAPPFLFAFVAVLITALVSDRVQSRNVPVIFHALLAMSGYVFLAVAGALQFGHTVRYLAVFPICAGFFSAVTIVITWTVNNQSSNEGKGTGMGILNVIGQMGPLIGTRLYPDSDAPYFVKGMSTCAVAMFLVALLALILRFGLLRANARLIARARANEVTDRPFLYLI